MAGSWSEEATAEDFAEKVLARSRQTTVVVDFWAGWCQPCKLLKPLLERMAEEFAGQFTLVKVDVDQAPQEAGLFGVSSIPAVYAVRDGKVVDSFVGLLSEGQLRDWLTGVLPSEAEKLVQAAAACEAENPAEAEALLRQAVGLDPQLAAATIALARLLLAREQWDEAAALLAQLEQRGFLEPAAQKLKAQLQLHAAGGGDSAHLSALRAALELTPKDLGLQCDLAEALLSAAQFEEGLAHALAVVENDYGKLRERARSGMIDAFRVLGDDSPLTKNFRRQLSLALN